MGRKRLGGILEAIERGPLRSPLFHWMCEHHDEIAAAAAGKRVSWDALCARFAALGLTDRTGKPPSPKTAKQTWWRAKTEVARLRKDRAKAEAALFPTLRPVPAKAKPNAPPPILASHSRQAPVTEQRADARRGTQMLADVRASLERRSGKTET